jgi:hypothetical protein
MNLPTFTAEASLYGTSAHYRLLPSVQATRQLSPISSRCVYPAAPPNISFAISYAG